MEIKYFDYKLELGKSGDHISDVVVSVHFAETGNYDKEVSLKIDFDNQSGQYKDNYSNSEFRNGKAVVDVLDKSGKAQTTDFNSWVEDQYKDILNNYVNRAFEDKLFDFQMEMEEGKSDEEVSKSLKSFFQKFIEESIKLITVFKVQHLPFNLTLAQNLLEGHGEDLLVYPDNDEYEDLLKLAL